MPKPTYLKFPVASFRHLETPLQKQGYRDYFAIVETSKLPDFTNWREINVRDPKLTGGVPKAIASTFDENPDMFLFMNRGLVVTAEEVSFDNKDSTLTLKFTDPKLHGLLDGGHTYEVIRKETQKLDKKEDSPRYVKIEIMEGFGCDDITNLVDARNTSNQVKDQSLMNLDRAFDPLKKVLANQDYYDDIAFKEYETGKDGEPKSIDIREIIALLTAFDKSSFGDSVHPIITYSSKAACLKHFANHRAAYEKIYPLADDILQLFDEIQLRLPAIYNAAGGRFGKLKGVHKFDAERLLPFSGKSSLFDVPAGFVYPVLASFRSMLEEKNGHYMWGKKLNPIKLINGALGETLANTIGNFAREAQNPTKTGKQPLVWQSCYQSSELFYFKA